MPSLLPPPLEAASHSSTAAAAVIYHIQSEHHIRPRSWGRATAAYCVLQGAIGRNFGGQRFGPRPIDLDVIFYEDSQLTIGTWSQHPCGGQSPIPVMRGNPGLSVQHQNGGLHGAAAPELLGNMLGFLDPLQVGKSLLTLADGQAEAVGTEHDRSLSVPHKRWQDRSFVKAPLADLACGGFRPCPATALHGARLMCVPRSLSLA